MLNLEKVEADKFFLIESLIMDLVSKVRNIMVHERGLVSVDKLISDIKSHGIDH